MGKGGGSPSVGVQCKILFWRPSLAACRRRRVTLTLPRLVERREAFSCTERVASWPLNGLGSPLAH
eukprot:6188723-Pleurochrysis_carterae.AAC.1